MTVTLMSIDNQNRIVHTKEVPWVKNPDTLSIDPTKPDAKLHAVVVTFYPQPDQRATFSPKHTPTNEDPDLLTLLLENHQDDYFAYTQNDRIQYVELVEHLTLDYLGDGMWTALLLVRGPETLEPENTPAFLYQEGKWLKTHILDRVGVFVMDRRLAVDEPLNAVEWLDMIQTELILNDQTHL